MALPTFSQIVQSMITFLQGKRPDIATQTGSVVNDVVISTVANQLSAQNGTDPSVYSELQYIQDLQAFVTNAADIVPADMDAIANNYGMTRLPGTQATGLITLRIRNYTTSTLPNPIIVPSGTTFSTLSTASSPAVSFSTTATVTFSNSLAPSYYNPNTGFYEQTVGIMCQSIGTVGNVGANTITSLVGSGLGIDAVTNTTATSGGTNVEDNVTFAARIQIKLSGNNVGTPNGIISLMETNPNVIQARLVGPDDPAMQRNQYGGAADVYIRGSIPITLTESFTYTTSGSQVYVMLNQPPFSVGLVTGVHNGSPYTFVPGTDYNVVLNPNSLYAGSTLAASYITFNVSTAFTITTVGLPFTVTSVDSGVNLTVSTTAGMVNTDTIVQGSNTTTITNIIDGTHLLVNDTTGWLGGATPAVDRSRQQFIVNSTNGFSVGNIIHQGPYSTTVTSIAPLTNTIGVSNTSGFGAGAATFSGTKPDNNTQVDVTYSYDSLIPILQALLDSNSNHIVGADILVLEAIVASINFTASIGIVPGFIPASVITNVQTALSTYINGLGLGAVIILSELVSVMTAVPGVSEVDLSSLILQSTQSGNTTTIPPGQQIAVGNQAYPVTNSLTITLIS